MPGSSRDTRRKPANPLLWISRFPQSNCDDAPLPQHLRLDPTRAPIDGGRGAPSQGVSLRQCARGEDRCPALSEQLPAHPHVVRRRCQPARGPRRGALPLRRDVATRVRRRGGDARRCRGARQGSSEGPLPLLRPDRDQGLSQIRELGGGPQGHHPPGLRHPRRRPCHQHGDHHPPLSGARPHHGPSRTSGLARRQALPADLELSPQAAEHGGRQFGARDRGQIRHERHPALPDRGFPAR